MAALFTLLVGSRVQADDLSLPPLNFLPGDDTVGPAATNQLAPAISRGDDKTLIAWTDHRSMPPGSGYEYETSTDIYGMRLDAAGNPLDPIPFVITQAKASQGNPQVSWNGTNWLVLFETTDLHGTGSYYQKYLAGVRVAPSGVVLDPAPIMILTASPTTNSWTVGSNGVDWLVVYGASDANSAIKIQRITAAGVVEQPPKTIVPSTYYLRFNFRLAFAGGIYLFTWTDFYDTYALRIDSDLNVLDDNPIVLVTEYGLSAMTSNGNQFYIVWHQQLPNFIVAVTGSRVNTNGEKLDGSGVDISGTNEPQAYASTGAVWDGANWKVTWGHNSTLHLARISSAGQVLDPGGIPLPGPSTGLTTATAGGGVQVVWSDYITAQDDILTANISPTNAVGPNITISTGSPMQLHPDAAAGSAGYMVAFRSDIAGVNRIMAQPLDSNGNALTAGPLLLGSGDNLNGPGAPTVAWNGSLYLVTWATSSNVYARRVLQDGTLVDASPIQVMPGFGPVDVSALGDTFLIAGRQSTYPQYIFPAIARVRGSDGVVLDPAGKIIGDSYTRSLAVTTFGDRWYVVWHQNWTHDDPNGSTVGAFVNADGSNTTPHSVYGIYSSAGGNGIFEVAVASSGSNAYVLQSAELTSGVETDLLGVIVDNSGVAVSTTNITPWVGNQYRPRVAWDGQQYVLAYNEQRNRFAPWTLDQLDARSDLFGMRVTSSGSVVDPRGFAFSMLPLSESFPNVVTSGGVSTFTASVMRNENPFAAYRVGLQRFGTGGNQWPVGVAGASSSGGDVPLPVTFSSAGSTDPDGTIVAYLWEFGDGATSTDANPSHTFTTPGQYVATLTVTDNQGAQAVNTTPILATSPNILPIAVAYAEPLSGPPPLDVTFFGEDSYDPDGSLGNYEWEFSDGSIYWGVTAYNTFYDPGTYLATLRVYDNRGGVGTAEVTIYVGVNGPPQAGNDAYQAVQDETLVVPAPGVLSNDSDPEGVPLTASLEQGPAHGDLTLNPNGSLSYTPDPGFTGPDSFTYRASDGELQSNIATVSLEVQGANSAPLAGDDAYLDLQDETLLVDAPGVLANDSDPDGDPLQAVLETDPLHGTLSLAPDGSFSYTPDAGFVGLDSFTYRAGDGDLSSDLAEVTVEVVAENAAPTAADDAYQVNEDVLLEVDPPGVLANDSDPNGDLLTAELVAGPANGSLTLNGDGSFSYEPLQNFNGTDSFSYRATDGLADSNVATVALTVTAVNDTPAALDDSFEMASGETLVVSAPGILANDSDLDGDSLTAVLDIGPAHGVLTLNDDGSFSYTPAAGYSGTVSFSYLAEDGNGGSAPATVTITVNEGGQVERLIFLPIALSRP